MMHRCVKCRKTFTTQQNLNTHLNRKFSCDSKCCQYCGITFKSQSNLKYHMDNSVCTKKNDMDLIIGDESPIHDKNCTDDLVNLDSDRLKLILEIKKTEIELEKTRIQKEATRNAGKMIDFEKSKYIIKIRAKPNIHIQNNSTNNNTIINFVTFGQEDISVFQRDNLEKISQNTEKWLTDLGIRKLYFNPEFPQNNIVRSKFQNSNKGEFFNGKFWQTSPKTEIAEKMLEHLVLSINRSFRTYPLNDQHIINIYPDYAEYVGDYIDDEIENAKHVKYISDNLTNMSKQLEQDQKAIHN